jgi:hypothetical protein
MTIECVVQRFVVDVACGANHTLVVSRDRTASINNSNDKLKSPPPTTTTTLGVNRGNTNEDDRLRQTATLSNGDADIDNLSVGDKGPLFVSFSGWTDRFFSNVLANRSTDAMVDASDTRKHVTNDGWYIFLLMDSRSDDSELRSTNVADENDNNNNRIDSRSSTSSSSTTTTTVALSNASSSGVSQLQQIWMWRLSNVSSTLPPRAVSTTTTTTTNSNQSLDLLSSSSSSSNVHNSSIATTSSTAATTPPPPTTSTTSSTSTSSARGNLACTITRRSYSSMASSSALTSSSNAVSNNNSSTNTGGSMIDGNDVEINNNNNTNNNVNDNNNDSDAATLDSSSTSTSTMRPLSGVARVALCDASVKIIRSKSNRVLPSYTRFRGTQSEQQGAVGLASSTTTTASTMTTAADERVVRVFASGARGAAGRVVDCTTPVLSVTLIRFLECLSTLINLP